MYDDDDDDDDESVLTTTPITMPMTMPMMGSGFSSSVSSSQDRCQERSGQRGMSDGIWLDAALTRAKETMGYLKKRQGNKDQAKETMTSSEKPVLGESQIFREQVADRQTHRQTDKQIHTKVARGGEGGNIADIAEVSSRMEFEVNIINQAVQIRIIQLGAFLRRAALRLSSLKAKKLLPFNPRVLTTRLNTIADAIAM